MKTCTKCGLPKEGTEFRKWRTVCRDCVTTKRRKEYHENPEPAREANRKRRLANPEATRGANLKADKKRRLANPEYHRETHLKLAYGISLIEWDEMMLNQGGRCAVCDTETKLCVDHDHKTGKVRGLLCNKCNTALGLLKESKQTITALLNYLTYDYITDGIQKRIHPLP